MNRKFVIILLLFVTFCNVNALKKVLKWRKNVAKIEPEITQIENPSKSTSSVSRNHRNGRCKLNVINRKLPN